MCSKNNKGKAAGRGASRWGRGDDHDHGEADRLGPFVGVGVRQAPGQCARFPGGLPHSYANDGAEPARLTMVVVIPPAQG